jgi:hypothetical protein
MKDPHVMCYNGKNWKLEHKNEKVRDLIGDKECHLEQQNDELKDKLDKQTIIKFDRYMKSLENDKQNEIRRGDIKLLLYNNREMIKETRRKMKEEKIKKLHYVVSF